jgi:exonuclease III
MATDVSGNGERMVFVYDKNKVFFKNIASEIVLKSTEQFNRTPYLVKFQTGWLKFNLCTVHLYFGDDKQAGYQRRLQEIDDVAGFLAKRATKERNKYQEENYILLGDMNIVSPQDETMKRLRKHKFVLPSDITKNEIPTNMNQDKFYDQIAFLQRKGELELGDSPNNSGVFNFYQSVFPPREFSTYYPLATNKDKKNKSGKPIWGETDEEKKTYFTKNWRTWQMSDHLPLWVEFKIDFTDKYLESLK